MLVFHQEADCWSRLHTNAVKPQSFWTKRCVLWPSGRERKQTRTKTVFFLCRLTKWFILAWVKECAKDKVCYESWPWAAEEQWQRMLGAGSDACRELLTLQKKAESLALPPSVSVSSLLHKDERQTRDATTVLFPFFGAKQSRIAGIKAAQLSCV